MRWRDAVRPDRTGIHGVRRGLLTVTDLTGRTEEAVAAWCQARAAEPLPPDRAPMWRARLGRTGDDRWLLVLVLHHLICDGWSLGVLFSELSTLYRDAVSGTTTPLPPPGRYPDYARWREQVLSTERGDRLRTYWRGELAGAPVRCRLPYPTHRPQRLSGKGRLHRFRISGHLARAVHRAARQLGGTPAHVLTAGFAVTLARLCDQREVVLALSSASRLRAEDAAVVGPVGEALLIRLAVGVDATLGDLVDQVRQKLPAALEYHGLGLAEVYREVAPDLAELVGSPQVLFTVVTTPPPALDLPGVSATVRSLPIEGVARTELYVVLIPGDEEITGYLEYSTDLFDTGFAVECEHNLVTTLESLLTGTGDRDDETGA